MKMSSFVQHLEGWPHLHAFEWGVCYSHFTDWGAELTEVIYLVIYTSGFIIFSHFFPDSTSKFKISS